MDFYIPHDQLSRMKQLEDVQQKETKETKETTETTDTPFIKVFEVVDGEVQNTKVVHNEN